MQCGGIHAITQTRGPWAIIKHMSEMGIAQAAGNRVPLHTVAVVDGADDVGSGDRRPEARPAGSGIELGSRVIEGRITTDTAIQAVSLVVIVLAGEGPFRCRLARDV